MATRLFGYPQEAPYVSAAFALSNDASTYPGRTLTEVKAECL